jgi:hypothetical protein
MKTKVIALLVLGLIAAPVVCSAQSLKAGTWTGSVIAPEGDETPVTYDVSVKGDSLGIMIHAGEHGDFAAEGGYHSAGKITFVFTPGIRVTCTLTKNEAGEFNGPCVGDDGATGQMKMVPPKE